MPLPRQSHWKELFEVASNLIDQVNQETKLIDRWSFGGGTALMLQIDHRESHDVDLFLQDPQLLGFLDPARNDLMLSIAPSSYRSDGIGHLKIAFSELGEIDFIVAQLLTRPGVLETEILGRSVFLETPAEVIAKKIVYRGDHLQPRDMFDIAATLSVLGEQPLVDALASYPVEISATVQAVERFSPQLALEIIGALAIRPAFLPLVKSAQANTLSFLKDMSR
jgi:hypothetical protein